MTSNYNLSSILLLGDKRLRAKCKEVYKHEVDGLQVEIDGMHSLITQFRAKYGLGRGIAAPQIGCMKRIVCLNLEQPMVLFNPVIVSASEDMFDLWDDCMSFPNLFVKVKRHKSIAIEYHNESWEKEVWHLEDGLSELMQHEIDHLDGILAIDRSTESFSWGTKPTN